MLKRRAVRERDSPAPALRRSLLATRRGLLRWGRRNYRSFPWRSEKNPFHALIAEVLLQRTRAEQVVPVFKAFKREFRNPGDLAGASRARVFKVIESLGLRWRVPLLRKLGSRLALLGGVPTDFPSLLELPGIGPYAAEAFVSFHTPNRGVILDSNVVRFYGRYLGLPVDAESRRSKLFRQIAEDFTPKKNTKALNYALLDFTRAICKPMPLCPICPLRMGCQFAVNSGQLDHRSAGAKGAK